MEKTIQALEQRLHELSEKLSVADRLQPEEIRRLGIEYSQLETKREELLVRWVEIGAVEM